ncbi:MAG: PEP/pyruvate-binding domain-containing protein [Desulfobulbaceae bacterium]|nr:PEP/pyruvate-binding domain-containing protein [Desulfobulbaceae bacterium]
MFNFFRKIYCRISSSGICSIENQQAEFARCYKSFRSLLTANNNALELMAEIEQALISGQSFSMAFVRGHCTALSINVLKMVKQLQTLSGGRYQGLSHPFNTISGAIEEILASGSKIEEGPYILPLSQVDRHSADMAGEKMANLGAIKNRVGFTVPEGFVITASAARYFLKTTNLQDEINRRLRTLDAENFEQLYETSYEIQQLICKAPLPDDLNEQILQEYQKMEARAGHPLLVAMRSSAIGEDSSNTSFAGQYRTQLNISAEFIAHTYKEIVASKFKSSAIIYRRQRGFRHQDVTMCVGCLAMVDAVVSGVAYSRSPTHFRSPWVEINAAPGLASQVVDGSKKTDFYAIERQAPYAVQRRKIHSSPGQDTEPVLRDRQAVELARTAVALEGHFGSPQDIEWSIDRQGRIVILQSRPLGLKIPPEGFSTAEVTQASEDDTAMLSGGIAVSPGVAYGTVYVVKSNVDLLQFPKGSVLVTPIPLPEWATLMSRAVAIVSDSGQAAAHLATVAREFGVPAIFGLEGASSVLQNGMQITVDATGHRVYKGKREDLLLHAPPPPNLMANSPVFKLLDKIRPHVTPLNLTDPASPFFRPSSCTTYHDITRFAHEKAVSEMFRLGNRLGYAEKVAKRLVGENQYQWWVINLDDGFREGFSEKEKFITTDDIVSLPMLAIWEGMTVIPWQGPPPVSLKGFGSIIFQSTMNPSLEPAVRSSMAGKNYFLIAKNYCNVSVRLGYHFALVESYVGGLLIENYISFQFKGGAADENRRLIRVDLLKGVLEQYGFRVVQKVDALTARIEKKSEAYLLDRLKVLGYLLIHTRQIDMVMGDDGMVDNYRRKILGELETILPGLQETNS